LKRAVVMMSSPKIVANSYEATYTITGGELKCLAVPAPGTGTEDPGVSGSLPTPDRVVDDDGTGLSDGVGDRVIDG